MAAASPYDVFGIPSGGDVPGAYDAEVRARLAARAARPAGGASAAAPSVGTPDNPAPVATATASATPSIGQRLLSMGRKALGPVAGAAIAAPSIYDMVKNGQVDQGNLENVAIGGLTAAHPLAGFGAGAFKAARDFALPYITRMIQPEKNPNIYTPATQAAVDAAGAAPAASPGGPIPAGTTTYPNAGAAPQSVRDLITGARTTPDSGTGVIQSSTGKVISLNTGAPDAASAVPAAAASARPLTPTLGTEGGIFSNLVPFVNKVSQAKLDTAYAGQAFNRGVKLTDLDIKGQTAQAAQLRGIGAIITGNARAAANATAGLKEATDASGRPGALDLRTNTFKPATPPLTEQDIQATMTANKLTRSQTLDRLVATGKVSAAEAKALGR